MFRTTARRQVEAREIAASARQFKDQVHGELEVRLAAHLRDGETMPDVSFFQELVGRLLDANGNKVGNTDGSHTSQLVSAASLRAQRNQLIANLRLRMRDVRYLVERSVDGPVFKAALRDRRLSKVKPTSLLQGARDLLAVLRDPELNVGAGDSALTTTAASFAEALEADADRLEQVLAQLSPRKKANQDSLGTKVADLQEAAETNRRCTDLLFGLYRVARLDYHASRLRTRARRKPEAATEALPSDPPVTPMLVN